MRVFSRRWEVNEYRNLVLVKPVYSITSFDTCSCKHRDSLNICGFSCALCSFIMLFIMACHLLNTDKYLFSSVSQCKVHCHRFSYCTHQVDKRTQWIVSGLGLIRPAAIIDYSKLITGDVTEWLRSYHNSAFI